MIWKGSRRMNSSSIAFSLIKKHLHHSYAYAGASTTFIYFFTIRGVSVHLFVCHCFSVPSWLLFLFFCKRKDLYTRFNWRDLDFKLEWSGTKDPVGHYPLNTTFLVTGRLPWTFPTLSSSDVLPISFEEEGWCYKLDWGYQNAFRVNQ